MTRSLVYIWGAHATACYGCFFASGAPSTIDIKAIHYPADPTTFYKASFTCDTCADENPVTPVADKNSILFSDPGTTSIPSALGVHIRNSWFFAIRSDDDTWVDDLQYIGGKFSASVPAPAAGLTKVSIWKLTNSSIFPSNFESDLTYTVRNAGSGLNVGAVNNGRLSLTGVTGFQWTDLTSGAYTAYRFATTSTGDFFTRYGGGTDSASINITNGSGSLKLGAEGNGATIFTGDPNYSGVIGTTTATPFCMATNGTVRMCITSAGIVNIIGIPVYADNAAALAGGLVAGNLYRTGADPDFVAVVH